MFTVEMSCTSLQNLRRLSRLTLQMDENKIFREKSRKLYGQQFRNLTGREKSIDAVRGSANLRYDNDIERILTYIENHSDEKITVGELAALSQYSFYHFCHAFSSYTGVSVAAYLRRQQMERAAKDLLSGKKAVDVAVARGFDTPSGFSKAFRKHYGMSPLEYRKEMADDRFQVTPEIRILPAFTAVGYRLAPPQREFELLDAGAYWLGKDFSFVSKEDYRRLSGPNAVEIGAWIQPGQDTGAFFYFFGPIVKDAVFVPDGLEVLHVEAADYAVFPVPPGNGNMTLLNENVRRMWKYIFGEWLPQNGDYRVDNGKIDFECYQTGKTEIFIPVEMNQRAEADNSLVAKK